MSMTAQHETRAGSSPAALTQGEQGSSGEGPDPKPDNPVGHQQEEKNPGTDRGADDEVAKGRLAPSERFTGHQKFYVAFLDGLGGMVLSGGVNFALAYVMYTTQDTTKNPIRLFQVPNTLAGDAAVTIIVQCILTWFVERGLVSYDLSRRSVQPIGFIPEPSHPWLRWLFFLPESDSSEKPKSKAKPEFASILSSILQQALRGFFLAVLGFFLLWPAGVGILTTLGSRTGGDYTYRDRWTPQVFKAILGGVLGLLTTPLMAMFWLVKAGWEDKVHTSAPEP